VTPFFSLKNPYSFPNTPSTRKKLSCTEASMKAFLEEQSRSSSNWKYLSHNEASPLQIEEELTSLGARELLWIDSVDFQPGKKNKQVGATIKS